MAPRTNRAAFWIFDGKRSMETHLFLGTMQLELRCPLTPHKKHGERLSFPGPGRPPFPLSLSAVLSSLFSLSAFPPMPPLGPPLSIPRRFFIPLFFVQPLQAIKQVANCPWNYPCIFSHAPAQFIRIPWRAIHGMCFAAGRWSGIEEANLEGG